MAEERRLNPMGVSKPAVPLQLHHRTTQERFDTHLYSCVDCLRFGCGLKKDMCSTGQSIMKQMQIIEKAMAKHGEHTKAFEVPSE